MKEYYPPKAVVDHYAKVIGQAAEMHPDCKTAIEALVKAAGEGNGAAVVAEAKKIQSNQKCWQDVGGMVQSLIDNLKLISKVESKLPNRRK